MMFSPAINNVLEKTHLIGPLIRLTGLIIAATAMQMSLRESRSSSDFQCDFA